MKYVDYLFEVIGEDSELCGERFFVEVEAIPEDTTIEALTAWNVAEEWFSDESLELIGIYDTFSADILGYDTY